MLLMFMGVCDIMSSDLHRARLQECDRCQNDENLLRYNIQQSEEIRDQAAGMCTVERAVLRAKDFAASMSPLARPARLL